MDNVSCKQSEFKLFEWNSLKDKLDKFTERAQISSGKLSNIDFVYYPNVQELWVKNSLHKLYNDRVKEVSLGKNNHDDYDRLKLIETVEFLSELVNKEPETFEVFGKFEYGVNINIHPIIPMDVLNNYFGYVSTRTNSFVTHGTRKGKPNGRSCYLTDYRIKFYDKSKESFLPVKGILRYEICNHGVGRLKSLLSKHQVTLKDLTEERTFEILSGDLLAKYDKIVRLPMDLSNLKREDLLEVFAYHQPQIQSYDKASMSTWKYAKHRSKGKKLMEKFSEAPFHKKLRDQIQLKLEELAMPNLHSIKGGVRKVTNN